jgi:anti-sigma-K factor RskA
VTHDELADLAGSYAIGALDGDELTTFSEHLLECWECRKAVMDYDEVYADNAKGLPPIEPSAGVRARLIARASGTEATLGAEPGEDRKDDRKPGGFVSRLVLLVAAACLLLALNFVWQAEEHERERDDSAALLALFGDPTAQTGALGGQEPSPSASGRIVWATNQVGLTTRGLPKLPAGSTYQLWAITGDAKQGIGVFGDADGTVQGVRALTAPIPAGVSAFALTIEPTGGSPGPTGAIYLLSGS